MNFCLLAAGWRVGCCVRRGHVRPREPRPGGLHAVGEAEVQTPPTRSPGSQSHSACVGRALSDIPVYWINLILICVLPWLYHIRTTSMHGPAQGRYWTQCAPGAATAFDLSCEGGAGLGRGGWVCGHRVALPGGGGHGWQDGVRRGGGGRAGGRAAAGGNCPLPRPRPPTSPHRGCQYRQQPQPSIATGDSVFSLYLQHF